MTDTPEGENIKVGTETNTNILLCWKNNNNKKKTLQMKQNDFSKQIKNFPVPFTSLMKENLSLLISSQNFKS